jgi:CNT family concentrative nucleoside transporter
MENLRSALAIPVLIFVLWLFSVDKRSMPWRTVLMGLALQIALAVLLLYTAVGRAIFDGLGAAINSIMAAGNDATNLLFSIDAADAKNVVLAASLVVGLVFFCSLCSVLSYIGLLQLVIRGIARTMWRTMRVSGSEALAASANIFLGQTEAALLVRPSIPTVTQPQLLTIMIGGMANVSFGMFPAYIRAGVDPSHLLVASVISAPASLLVAKVLMPDRGAINDAPPLTSSADEAVHNIFDAACRGASDGAKLAINVLAMLIAFVSLAKLADILFALISVQGMPLSFSRVLGWLFTPVAYLIGIPTADAPEVGALLGKKLFLNEFVAYLDLGNLKTTITERSYVLATYALCGFANFSSVAIQIGGLGGLEPSRRADLAKLGLTALLGGTITTLLTAAVIGTLL